MATDNVSTIGWFLVVSGGTVIYFSSHGRGLTQIPTDVGDLAMAAITGGDIKAVLARRSVVQDTTQNSGFGSSLSGETNPNPGLQGPIGSKVAGLTIYGKTMDLGNAAKGYQWGATGPTYYDCSGLPWAALKSLGYTGPRFTTMSMATAPGFTKVTTPQVGDMVVWERGTGDGHMGVVAADTSKFYSALSPRSGIRVLPIATITAQKGYSPVYYRWTS